MADKLGIPRTTYLYWETKTPDVEKVKAVARALGKPENFFFDKNDESVEYKTVENIDSQVNEGPLEYEVKGKWYSGKDAFITALLEEKDRAIKKAEENARKLESFYEDAKNEKGRLLNQVDKLADIIDNTLKEISVNLREAASNLKHNREDLALLKDQTYIVSTQLEHQREAFALGFPGDKKRAQPAPFVKKGKAGSGVQHDGGKKSKGH